MIWTDEEKQRANRECAKEMRRKLQRTIDRQNQRQRENFAMYAAECKKQGKQVGEPIDLMQMLDHNLQDVDRGLKRLGRK